MTLTTTQNQLVEYSKNMEVSAELENKLESYAENSKVDGFQLVGISLEDLYAANWNGIFEGAEYQWKNYKDVQELTGEEWGHTLHQEEADYLIKTLAEPRDFFVGLICQGVVVTTFESC